MADEFGSDVFLSCRAKEREIVGPSTEHLRGDGLRAGSDEWEIQAGASIPAQIEEGLEHEPILPHPHRAVYRRVRQDQIPS
jgi:hypothetical protein